MHDIYMAAKVYEEMPQLLVKIREKLWPNLGKNRNNPTEHNPTQKW